LSKGFLYRLLGDNKPMGDVFGLRIRRFYYFSRARVPNIMNLKMGAII